MEDNFLVIFISLFVFLFSLMLVWLYNILYCRHSSYVQHKDIEPPVVKEVELPPIGKEWDYNEGRIQEEDDNTLIDISVT
tara:strand:+ start:1113 stop:1352 length:240 start_codon:yes stop_codon:yes gene_type:complete